MGQREPCRAQLATISRVVLGACQSFCHLLISLHTYSAYCITPFVPSWLGNGTSLCSFPVIVFIEGGGGGFVLTMPGLPIAGSAGFELEDDMKAALATLKGWRAVMGLAMRMSVFCPDLRVVATYRAAPTASPALLSRTWLWR